MKTTNTFYWSFIDTLILNVATIAAIVVGVCQFLIRTYNENNGNEKLRKVTQTVLQFVNTLIAYCISAVSEPVTVPVQQQSTKRAKVA
jgi:heme/copper-type cytochrome/quinol oxidase subunit 2